MSKVDVVLVVGSDRDDDFDSVRDTRRGGCDGQRSVVEGGSGGGRWESSETYSVPNWLL